MVQSTISLSLREEALFHSKAEIIPGVMPRGIVFSEGIADMIMKLPQGHESRLSGFSIDGILDETLREGSERCMFSVPTSSKLPLIRCILKSGVKDVIFGSGPNDPNDLADVLVRLQREGALADQKFSFVLLLNCFEPLMPQFQAMADAVRDNITISFGMITHDSETCLFERTVDQFRQMGFSSFRVSLLNKFGGEIDERDYESIVHQIDRAMAVGIGTIRINDSLGTLYPEAMAVLAANLRYDYPTASFCLHAHNDRGFALQNALTSIYHGFNLIEGGFAQFGNRSGLPAIELLDRIFQEKSITLASGALDAGAVQDASRLSEETFLVIPDLFRPISGMIVDCENMGVTNIPDYLGSSSASRYFLNTIGLHQSTLCNIVRDLGLNDQDAIEEVAEKFRTYLDGQMREITVRKSFEYKALRGMVENFYTDDVLFSERVYDLARDYLQHRAGMPAD